MRKEGWIGMPSREGWFGALAALAMFGGTAFASDTCRDMQLKGLTVNCTEGTGVAAQNKTIAFNYENSEEFGKYVSTKDCNQFLGLIEQSSLKNGGKVTLTISPTGKCSMLMEAKDND